MAQVNNLCCYNNYLLTWGHSVSAAGSEDGCGSLKSKLEPHVILTGPQRYFARSGGFKPVTSNGADHGGWSWEGVTLPNGTKLCMSYNGQTHTGEIVQGGWHVGGGASGLYRECRLRRGPLF